MTADDPPSHPVVPSEARGGGALWFAPSQRLPRRGQPVRVVTTRGVAHDARFEVVHTDDWPSGVSWELSNGCASIPFAEVARWSPDATAEPPPELVPPPPVRTPAIMAEVEREIARTGSVLRLLPPTHLDWSPHPTVPTLRTLAHRLVRMVARMGWILDLDTVELAFEPDLPDLGTVEGIIATFAANESGIQTLAQTIGPEALQAPWTLERNAAVVVETTRGEALRRFGLTPLVQHRGEMSLMLAAIGVTPPHAYPEWAFRDGPLATPSWAP